MNIPYWTKEFAPTPFLNIDPGSLKEGKTIDKMNQGDINESIIIDKYIHIINKSTYQWANLWSDSGSYDRYVRVKSSKHPQQLRK